MEVRKLQHSHTLRQSRHVDASADLLKPERLDEVPISGDAQTQGGARKEKLPSIQSFTSA
jgi:hypothetical protein